MERQFGLCFPGRLRENLLAAGATVYDLGPVRIRRPWTAYRARARLRALLREVHFDAVMTHACWRMPCSRRSSAAPGSAW